MHKKFVLAILVIFSIPYVVNAEETTWIIEVDRNPHEVKEHIEKYYPLLKVEFVYDTLIQALAVTGNNRHIEKLYNEQFIKSVNKVKTYRVPSKTLNIEIDDSIKEVNYNPSELNLTGKGVKIGVIDTGIDYTHPDLEKNYKGGFDVVDFDDDPMETLPEEGIPTIHGTHVAGIIASDGKIRGVAPDAEIYAYRALGPGGSGTSAQIMAALEKAVKDGMDIVNMSLGSQINSPDDPMTKAVNEAIKLGTTVVIANGNSGPDQWTVGSPATSDDAISVGASITTKEVPLIKLDDEHFIQIRQLPLTEPWDFQKDFPLIFAATVDTLEPSIHDRIILIKKNPEETYSQLIRKIENLGATAVIFFGNEEDDPNEWDWVKTTIPAAYVTELEASQIMQNNWLKTIYKTISNEVAPFSSRGPVASTWQIKPDILAPGVDILSTVPNGYAPLQGTSMAAPYITGVLALLKEANPDATPQQLKDRLLSTADLFTEKDVVLSPSVQGNGQVNVKEAVETKFAISNSRLHFGKIDKEQKSVKESITITNYDDQPLKVRFNHPRRQTGITWILPLADTIPANQSKTFDIEAIFQKNLLVTGMQEGYLDLQINGEKHHVSYLFINETTNYPRISGMEMSMQPFQNDKLKFRLYIPEKLDELTVTLYDRNFIEKVEILSETNIEKGYIEEELNLLDLPSGEFQAVIVAVQNDEQFVEVTDVFLP